MSWPFLASMLRFDVLESTSTLARQLAVEGAVALPLAVWADRQTRGRGRGEHQWWSDEGSLTFTIVLDPAAHALRMEHGPRLALATAVAIVDAISPFLPCAAAGIRWPNDIEVGGRKIGGILPEIVETPRGPRFTIGIGLNVNTRLADAPSDIQRTATSLSDFGDSAPERELILRAILARFPEILPLLSEDSPALAGRWRQLDRLRDRPVRIDLGPRTIEGVGQGVDAEGALLVACGSQQLRLFGGQVLREPRDDA